MAAQITLAQLDGQLDDVDGNLGTISNLKTIRVIRLFKLVRLLRVEALLGHLEFSLPLLSAVVGLLRLLLMISILSHLTACVWYYVATRNMYNSWVSKYHLGCCSPNQVAPSHCSFTPICLGFTDSRANINLFWFIVAIGRGPSNPSLLVGVCCKSRVSPILLPPSPCALAHLRTLWPRRAQCVAHFASRDFNSFFAYQVEAPIDHGCETVEALPSISALYSEAMYWSITTISAVGYGDVLPCNPEEENMAVVAMVLGSALFAYVVGAISSVVSSSSSQDKKQHEKMMNLREYLNLVRSPSSAIFTRAKICKLQLASRSRPDPKPQTIDRRP